MSVAAEGLLYWPVGYRNDKQGEGAHAVRRSFGTKQMNALPLHFELDEAGFRFEFVDALIACHARRLFIVYLSGQVEPGCDLFAVELIFGELIANVAKHASGPVEVRLRWEEHNARLEVADRGAGYDPQVGLPDHFDEAHRGLFIVAAYADDLRVERRGEHTVTSVSLPLRRRSAAA